MQSGGLGDWTGFCTQCCCSDVQPAPAQVVAMPGGWHGFRCGCAQLQLSAVASHALWQRSFHCGAAQALDARQCASRTCNVSMCRIAAGRAAHPRASPWEARSNRDRPSPSMPSSIPRPARMQCLRKSSPSCSPAWMDTMSAFLRMGRRAPHACAHACALAHVHKLVPWC